MKYKIIGENMPAVSILLDTGESIYTQSGGMTYMQDGITMETNMRGGFMGGLGRLFTGESLFMATFRSERPAQEILISSTMPGSIVPLKTGWFNGIYLPETGFSMCDTECTACGICTVWQWRLAGRRGISHAETVRERHCFCGN